jgi:CheY-like chemotaxis protein
MSDRKWILLVEDNAFDADLAIRSLGEGKCPHEVQVARDGEEALDRLYRRGEFAACPEDRPAVVLLDLKMPKVDGLEVLRQLKADPRLRTIPVVMLTSSREVTDVDRCYGMGANAYVVKPVNYNQYSAAIQAIGAFWAMTNEPAPPRPAPDSSIENRGRCESSGAAQAHSPVTRSGAHVPGA